MTERRLADPPGGRLEEGIARVQLRLADTLGRIRIPEFLAGFGLVLFGVSLPGIPIPMTYLGLIALVGLASLRRPITGVGTLWWLGPALALLLVQIGAVSLLQLGVEGTWLRRWIRLAIVLISLMAFLGGRIHLPSVLRGLLVGLIVNVLAFFAGLAPDTYGGFLTGWFRDKNQAGLGYVVYGILLLQLLRAGWWRFLGYLGVGAVVWLTGSRTALGGWLVAGLWMAISPRVGAVTRYLTGFAGAALVVVLESQFARIGRFADRAGTDALRERIAEATDAKLATASRFGEGLGGATVRLDERTWFFHSSYKTLLYEGGWLFAVAVVAITVIVALRPLAARRTSSDAVAVEAAAIALLVCAWTLGEVFLTPPWMVLMATAVWHYLLDTEREAGREGLPRPAHVIRDEEHEQVLDRLGAPRQ